MGNRLVDCKEYIDEQWKLRDENEEWRDELFAKSDDGQMYNADPCATVVKEIESRRGLEIGPDGTVTAVK